jgi:hypothetical protein
MRDEKRRTSLRLPFYNEFIMAKPLAAHIFPTYLFSIFRDVNISFGRARKRKELGRYSGSVCCILLCASPPLHPLHPPTPPTNPPCSRRTLLGFAIRYLEARAVRVLYPGDDSFVFRDRSPIDFPLLFFSSLSLEIFRALLPKSIYAATRIRGKNKS